jgi:hypothetical protein
LIEEEQRKRERKEGNLVDQVEAVVARNVAEEVHVAIEMGNGENFTTDTIVESIAGTGVDKAISYPHRRANSSKNEAEAEEKKE